MGYEQSYRELLWNTLQFGQNVTGRNGDTKSLFGQTLTVKLRDGFPVLTGRKMHMRGILAELAGFLRGAEDLQTYKDLGCNYWDANAAAWPENKSREDMQIGQYVGPLWRNFQAADELDVGPDQLVKLLHSLRTEPHSRRHVLSAWHPGAKACLPPCTVMAIFNVQGRVLNCHVTQRSADICLGVPSDVAQYALLTHLLAKDCDLVVGKLMFTFVDAHVYASHFESAKEYLAQAAVVLPTLHLDPTTSTLEFMPRHVKLENYFHGPAVAFPFEV